VLANATNVLDIDGFGEFGEKFTALFTL